MSSIPNGVVFFPAFNAKLMKVDQIVESFVPSELFQPAIGVSHTLVMGPRGSGKTTLLKMLSVDFLRRWKHDDADSWRNSAKFNGIFLPADIVWAESARDNQSNKLDDHALSIFSQSLFCTSVLLAETAVEAPEYGFFEATNENLKLAALQLSKLWKLPNEETTFTGLRNAMLARLMESQAFIRRTLPNANLNIAALAEKLLFVAEEPHTMLNASLIAFDKQIGDSEGKWALLVDEMEIAPPAIQSTIIHRFRSGSDKLMYKVAVVPCTDKVDTSLDSELQSMPQQDFKRVSLWYSKKLQAKEFSNQLFKAWLKRSKLEESISPIQLLGKTLLIDDDESPIFSEESSKKSLDLTKIFVSLNGKDITFKKYAEDRGILISDLNSEFNSKFKHEIRKIAPTVAFRDAVLRSYKPELTSKKSMGRFYSGWEAISAICEGNPRWLNGYLSSLPIEFSASKSPVQVSTSVQSRELKKTANGYKAMLQTIACKDPMIGFSTSLDVYKLLDQIGERFKRILYEEPFSPEPALSFVVDDKVSNDMEDALKIALNHGAIVYAEEVDSSTVNFRTLRNKRFRLTYLLATEHNLILRLHKSISLSTLLMQPSSDLKNDAVALSIQTPKTSNLGLFD
jgi:energy-coupling factor transporter ATP-binding protein EcfA2